MSGRFDPIPTERSGAVPVAMQDQDSRAFDIFFMQDVGSPMTLTVDAVADAYSISATTGHGLVAGNTFVLIDPVSEQGYTGQVVSVEGDNTVNIDTALNFGFLSASTILQQRTKDLNVDGSTNRQTFSVGSPLTGTLDITRFIFQITTTAVPAWDEFGDIEALTRGCAMRVVNGETTNLWNIKSNSELANLMYDMKVYDSDLPFNVNGLAGRLTYAGQEKHGVVLRITGGEAIEFIVQDALQTLLSFRIIACGHLVTD